jgi:hypothetical protein
MRNPYKLGNYLKAVSKAKGGGQLRVGIIKTLQWVLSEKNALPMNIEYRVPPRKGITKKQAKKRARLRSVPKTAKVAVA